jgi:hypothetical protein
MSKADPVPDLLKLVALDAEDLAVLSAHAQDALVRAADLVWLPRERRFAMELRRFDWQGSGKEPRRRLAALHFERVNAARLKGVTPGTDTILSLLAVTFDEAEAPSGTVTLIFAGDKAIALDVECIEAQLADLGPVWEASARPSHEDHS